MFSRFLRKLIVGIDALADATGRIVRYLVILLILVLTFEVVSRYVFTRPTIWALETSQMVFGAIGALCWGYTLKIGGHVRVDVFYTMFSTKGKAVIDVVLTILFLFPFQLILIYAGTKWTLFALKTGERMVDSSWLPPSAPFRAVLTVGFVLFFVQGVAEFIKNVYYLATGEHLIGEGDVGKNTKEGLV